MRNKGVNKTAMATPGLSITLGEFFLVTFGELAVMIIDKKMRYSAFYKGNLFPKKVCIFLLSSKETFDTGSLMFYFLRTHTENSWLE